MGGAIKDSGGNIIRLYAGSMGNSTNNATEFGALELGLEILRREGMTNTIVEGDSTLVINTTKNPGSSEKYEHSGVALGPQVNKWPGRQTSQ
jgi:ribonuclease HI